MSVSRQSKDSVTLILMRSRDTRRRSLTLPISPTISASTGRSFSWGAKNKWSSNSNGKSIRDKVNKANISKAGLQYPHLEHQAFIRHFLPAQGWRSASHWKSFRNALEKNEESEKDSTANQQNAGVEDWYARWERQQMEKFEAFKKKIDQDPIDALFGKSNKWLGWTALSTSYEAPDLHGQSNILKKKADEYLKNDKARKAMKDTHGSAIKGEYANGASQREASRRPIKREIEEQEYEIDPITLHKVPKTMKPNSSSKETTTKSSQEAFDIPVKTFKPSPRVTTLAAKGTLSTQVDDWLAREGFGHAKDVQKPMSPDEYGTSLTPQTPTPTPKIESALDRHAQKKEVHDEKSYSTPVYETKERIDEDIDSLRASDIRASFGKGNQEAKTSDSKLAQTAKSGDSSAASSSEMVKAEKLPSLINSKIVQIQSKIVPLKVQLDSMKGEYDDLRHAWLAETRRLKARKTSKLHEQEVIALKAAMEAAELYRGDGDVTTKVHQFAVNKFPGRPEAGQASEMERGGEGDMAPNVAQYASRDRWYKRKAPHAQCEMENKMQQLSKDKALVREVRGIYEDTYGVIDTKHRQEELRGEGDMSPNVAEFASRDRWYKRKGPFGADVDVLPKKEIGLAKGYMMLKEDPSAALLLTKDATPTPISIPEADQGPAAQSESVQPPPTQPTAASSSATAATARQIADLKAQIDQQAAQLQAHRKQIQFLRSKEAATLATPATTTTTTTTSSTTSKPDFNNKEPTTSTNTTSTTPHPRNNNHPQYKQSQNVRRLEPVFSGRRNNNNKNKENDYKKRASHRRRKTLKHVFLTGSITAACCYATGVAVEWMKGGRGGGF